MKTTKIMQKGFNDYFLNNCFNNIYKKYKEKAKEDYAHKEMACVTMSIFGGDITDYINEYYGDDIREEYSQDIYNFQTNIYNQFIKGEIGKEDYEYFYIKSKKMLMEY